MKSTLKRFLSLVLCMCMVMALLPNVTMTAFAATSGTVTGLADENIGLSFTGDADDAWSANGTSITGAATSTGGTCSDTSHKSTLTITNKKSTTATLSFDYSIEQNSGKIQVDGTAVSSGASFTKELAANESVKVYIESGSTSAATKITLTNVVLVSDVNATATFVPAENGTYTVDGKLITEEYSNTQSSMTAYQVVATPAAGYQFMGWYDVSNEKYISTSAKAALNIENDCTITARFASKTAALFETGGQRFDDLGDAVSYAQANSQSKITLATDGSISGTYTIPAGITLLIPFDEAGTLYTDAPAAIRTAPASKPFRTLTMSDGASITVNGAISLGGRYFAAGGGQQGRPVGDYGYIKMADNSSITVKNGGKLYAWGFISGSGSVLAESGATVYEFYQIADFRGGSASSGMGHGVFPFSQYFVQNIEVPLTLNAGANEQVYSGVYAMSTTYTTAINFIGDTGMFKVESGSFTKDYDEKTDRLVFTVNGEAALNTLSLTLAGMDVNSASYVLPITNNITINIQSGNVTINQDAALLAGVQVNIAEGAGLTVANGKNIYFYDSDEWSSDNFVWGPCKFKSVAYAPGKAYNRSNNDLVDAKMDVNGNVTAIGAIYTTKGGADICSSNGTGKYIQQGTPGTATATYQYNAGSSAVTIPITAAKLHNADGTYTETATASAGNIINYVNGVWGGEEPTELTVTFEANGSAEYPVEGTMAPQSVTAKKDTALNANTFTREGYKFLNWNTAADGTGDSYTDSATVNLTEDLTLYAQWQANTYTVTWVDEDGTELETDENVPYGTTPEYNGETPTKTGDAQYTYTFTGWDPAVSAVTGDVTYKAIYTQTVNQYTITWKNWDGTELKTEQVAYGEVPAYTGETPTREGDAEHTYTFSGWTPEIQTVTGEAEYTAVFTDTINTYTVTWKNWDGTVLETDENVEYGTTPEYNGATPTKTGDAQYSYTFKGWSPAVDTVTGDITYTAVFEETVNQYTITWKNWDDTVLKTEQVSYGTTPVYSGDTPAKEGDAQYSYAFTGWTPEITAVTGNAEYTAQFQESVNTYTVTWQDANGTVLETDENVAYGTVPTYDGETPTKAADAQYTYAFKGWNPEITAVTGNVTYTAEYTATVNTYTVTWVDESNNVLETDTDVAYGTMPSYDGETPTKADDDSYSYTFSGWTPEVSSVTGNMTYQATFTATLLVKHTVTFNANGGEGSMDPQVFIQGRDTKLTANTFTRENYKFTGWNTAEDGSGATYTDEGAIINLTEDLTLYAQWQIWNGWFTDVNGKQYYKDGELQKTGWTVIDGNTYYLDTENGYVATGITTLVPDGATEEARCVFDAEGVFQSDVTGVYSVGADTYWLNSGIIEEEAGLKRVVKENGEVNYYYFAVQKNLEERDGLTLSAAVKSTVLNGKDCWLHKTNGLALPEWGYYFDENGVILHDEDTSKNGILKDGEDLFYYVDGIKAPAGMIKIGDDYYYANSKGQLIVNQTYYCSRMNGLMEEGTYAFDAEGKLIQGATDKNGIVKDDDGVLRYYVNGKVTYVGLIEIDGDFYYVRSNGEVVTDCVYWITWTHGLKEAGYYTFDENGKLTGTPKNGIVEEDGVLHYYVNGKLTYAGLIKIGDDYYYVNSKCEVVRDCDYYISWTHDLMPQGRYHFDADGKLTGSVAPLKNGIYEEDGSLYFYRNGERAYAGLIQIDGDYYYVRSTCEVVHDRSYYVYWTHGLMPEGYYNFDSAGRMILDSETE